MAHKGYALGMVMMRTYLRTVVRPLAVIFAAAIGLVAGAGAASAHQNSEPKTPTFTLTNIGIDLQQSTLEDNGHINIKLSSGKEINIHVERKCADVADGKHPECGSSDASVPNKTDVARLIGKTLIPWSVFGTKVASDSCITWVQVSTENYHFGEHGEKQFCLTDEEPTPEQPSENPPVDDTDVPDESPEPEGNTPNPQQPTDQPEEPSGHTDTPVTDDHEAPVDDQDEPKRPFVEIGTAHTIEHPDNAPSEEPQKPKAVVVEATHEETKPVVPTTEVSDTIREEPVIEVLGDTIEREEVVGDQPQAVADSTQPADAPEEASLAQTGPHGMLIAGIIALAALAGGVALSSTLRRAH